MIYVIILVIMNKIVNNIKLIQMLNVIILIINVYLMNVQ